MKKKLNVESIQSELRGGSAFFPGYKSPDSPPPPPEEVQLVENVDTSPPEHTPVEHQTDLAGVPPTVPLTRPEPVPQGVPRGAPLIPKRAKRPIRQRQPFDIYEDQYQSLKKIANAERGFENGRSMGQMVREAIDTYLRDHAAD
jgi:hypothetical protein